MWRRGRGPLHDDVKYRYGIASGASSNPSSSSSAFFSPPPPARTPVIVFYVKRYIPTKPRRGITRPVSRARNIIPCMNYPGSATNPPKRSEKKLQKGTKNIIRIKFAIIEILKGSSHPCPRYLLARDSIYP